MTGSPSGDTKIFLVAVEESGDQLGAALMRALRQRLGQRVLFSGVGGRRMAAEGLEPAFDRRFLDHGCLPNSAPGAGDDWAPAPDVARVARTAASCARGHRQPGLFNVGGGLRPPRRSRAKNHRLRLAVGLGLAAGARALDAALCRSHPGAAAVRTRCPSPPRRPAMQLRRTSDHRADCAVSSQRRRGAAA